MELKGRLGLIAAKVPKCRTVCDIGTDHAYIPIYLVRKGICREAIASDVRKGPIMAAEENIERFGLEAYVKTRLGDGLKTISEDEIDVIIIAGMGGELIKNILAESYSKAQAATAIILQPMNSHEILRGWLYGNGFEIYDEEMVSEGRKIYTVMSARWTGAEGLSMEDINLHIGQKLIEKKDPLLKPYIANKLMFMDRAITELQKSGEKNQNVLKRYIRLREDFEKVVCMLDGK